MVMLEFKDLDWMWSCRPLVCLFVVSLLSASRGNSRAFISCFSCILCASFVHFSCILSAASRSSSQFFAGLCSFIAASLQHRTQSYAVEIIPGFFCPCLCGCGRVLLYEVCVSCAGDACCRCCLDSSCFCLSAFCSAAALHASLFFSRPGNALHRPRSSPFALPILPSQLLESYVVYRCCFVDGPRYLASFVRRAFERADKTQKQQQTEAHPLPCTLQFVLITGQNSLLFTGSDIVRSHSFLSGKINYIVDAYTHTLTQ